MMAGNIYLSATWSSGHKYSIKNKNYFIKMLEELCYVILYIVLYFIVDYQFKYCIPTVLFLFKIIEAAVLLLLIKLYIYIRIQRNDMNTIIPTWDEIVAIYGNFTELTSNLEL